jgi:hypothetical protein
MTSRRAACSCGQLHGRPSEPKCYRPGQTSWAGRGGICSHNCNFWKSEDLVRRLTPVFLFGNFGIS